MERSKSRVRSRRTQHRASEDAVRVTNGGGTGGVEPGLVAGGAGKPPGVAEPSVTQKYS